MEKRLTADLNVVANSNLEIQLLDGDLNIIQKLDDEPNDVGGLTSAELKAKFDESGNIIKKYINETLIPAVLTEDATEESRKQAEAARVAAEQGRVTAEEGRVSAEAARAAAEQARSEAESSRVSAENAREAAEQARADETAGIVARATAQANAAASSASQAAGSEQSAKDAAGTATGAASSASAAAAAASGSASQAQASAAAAAQSAASVDGVNKTAQSWAVGGTGTRPGEDTDNAKYWAQQAQAAVGGDFATKEDAQGYVTAHNESDAAHPDLRAAVAGSVRYNAAQSLSDTQKAQARTNIGAADKSYTGSHKQNGTLIHASFDTKGWYRIVTGSRRSGGILTVQHSYNNGGPSSIKLLVTLAEEGGSLKCIEYTNYITSAITNARIVKNASDLYCIDVYYNVNGSNASAIDFINTGREEAEVQAPVYIGVDDTLPSGETIKAAMEYLNPPMELGVEYRTTERYLGKSVYCKLVDFGKLPNNTYKDVAHGISNLQWAISVSGDSNGDNLIGNMYITYVHVFSTNIRIKTNADRSGMDATVLIKYTKTTD